MENGTKLVDINEVIFVGRDFNEEKEEEASGRETRDRKKRPKIAEVDKEDSEEEEVAEIGLVSSHDFIPNDLFEQSLQTGKRMEELEGSVPATPTGEEQGMVALILTPTRELAIQIRSHIEAVSKFTEIEVRDWEWSYY